MSGPFWPISHECPSCQTFVPLETLHGESFIGIQQVNSSIHWFLLAAVDQNQATTLRNQVGYGTSQPDHLAFSRIGPEVIEARLFHQLPADYFTSGTGTAWDGRSTELWDSHEAGGPVGYSQLGAWPSLLATSRGDLPVVSSANRRLLDTTGSTDD